MSLDLNKIVNSLSDKFARVEDIGNLITILDGKSNSNHTHNLANITEDNTHQSVTLAQKTSWDNKADTSDIPTKISELQNDTGYLTEHQSLSNYVPKTDVINDTVHTDTNKPLSANIGKELKEAIDNLSARGRFLALWNCSTGLAMSNPTSSPYTYKTGDYFVIGTVGSNTNYKPNGSTYTTGVASTTTESNSVSVDDVYYYDGTNWRLQVNTQKTVSFTNIGGNATDNSSLASALNSKVTGTKSTEITGTGDDSHIPTTKAIVDYIESLDASDVEYPLPNSN